MFLQILMPHEEDAAVRTLEMVDSLISKTPAYLLSCDISEEAVKTSFEAMTHLKYEEYKKTEKKGEKDED